MTTAEIIKTLGGPASIGRQLGIRGQAVSLWIRAGRIPVDRVPQLERIAKQLGAPVRAEQMRPDVEWSVIRGQSQGQGRNQGG